MVGVPGKSKGCSTCRRRKKGCDQKRPICGQCSASGYVCGGYQRDLTFVLHPASKTVEKAIFLPSKPRPLLLTTHSTFERSAITAQCQELFFDVYLPRGQCTVNDQFILKCGRPRYWTDVMRRWLPRETSLELAFTAFSMSRVGRNRDDPRLIKESTRYYGKALKTLQKALYDPSRMHSEAVLTACLLLGLYETFEGAGGKSVGWVSHAQGAARIVELRGPERHAENPAHLLFLGTRLCVIYSAILRRKKTFLGDEEWLTIPWRKEIKTGLDRLIDIATHVPGLLEQFDAVRAQMSSTARQALQACLATCRQLQRSLHTWTTIRRPNSEPIAAKHDPTGPNDTYPFAQVLTYENHLFLNANLILWSVKLVVSNTISEIEFLLASFGFQSASMMSSSAAAIQESQECANRIAQSIPFCMWTDMGDMGIDYIQFPMTLAFQFFMKSNNSAVCSWMLEVAKQMQGNGLTKSLSRHSSPTSRMGDDGVAATFGAHGLKAGRTTSKQSASATASSSSVPLYTDITYNALGPQSDQPHAEAGQGDNRHGGYGSDSRHSTDDPDFDAEYDLDSDYERLSSKSNDSGPSLNPSRVGSDSRLGGSWAAANNKSLTDTSDFTFIQENPARYYIDRSDMTILAKA